jgi:polyketide biosynthesis enoyl-CoA hydratase PksH
MTFQTLLFEQRDEVVRVHLNRPDAGNAIDDTMLEELCSVVTFCEDTPAVRVLVLFGSHDVFCAGGDLNAFTASAEPSDPEPLYDLWLRLLRAPFITVAAVRGRVQAGGVGLVSACDLVLADHTATFNLSEMLFGLFPACVLPFLTRRIGAQRAHFMTLTTQTVNSTEAEAWGLVDRRGEDLEELLRQHLLRLRRLRRPAIQRYKQYAAGMTAELKRQKPEALAANRAMFRDPVVRAAIVRYTTESRLPWED